MYTVYMHINKINNKKYIGITKQNPASERWGRNGQNYKSTPHFYNAINKYKWNNFEHCIVKDGLTKEEACKLEIELIAKYNTQNKDYGYNILSGGQSPCMPKEIRKKLSIALKGNTNGKGYPCTKEKREKISKAQKGKRLTEEHKVKLSKAAHNRHTPCSEAKKIKLSEAYPNKREVYCFETDCVYPSVHECARQLNVYPSAISAVCRGKHKHTKGYSFKYYTNNNVINA